MNKQEKTILTQEAPRNVRIKGNVGVSDVKYGPCPWCGKTVLSSNHSHYCGHCGNALKWNETPEAPYASTPEERVLQGFLADIASSESILDSVGRHDVTLKDASQMLAICVCACDVISPGAFVGWLKERMTQDVCLKGCVKDD